MIRAIFAWLYWEVVEYRTRKRRREVLRERDLLRRANEAYARAAAENGELN